MCCPVDCNPDLKRTDWFPCIECMDKEMLQEYRNATGDIRKSGYSLKPQEVK